MEGGLGGTIEGKVDMAYLGVIKSILKVIVMVIAQNRTQKIIKLYISSELFS